jgi:hypothetical protein
MRALSGVIRPRPRHHRRSGHQHCPSGVLRVSSRRSTRTSHTRRLSVGTSLSRMKTLKRRLVLPQCRTPPAPPPPPPAPSPLGGCCRWYGSAHSLTHLWVRFAAGALRRAALQRMVGATDPDLPAAPHELPLPLHTRSRSRHTAPPKRACRFGFSLTRTDGTRLVNGGKVRDRQHLLPPRKVRTRRVPLSACAQDQHALGRAALLHWDGSGAAPFRMRTKGTPKRDRKQTHKLSTNLRCYRRQSDQM